jgi:ABC-type glycerol-3-phosphate transport system substrate-binding protein
VAGDPNRPTLTLAGKLVIALFVAACVVGAYMLAHKRGVLPAGLPGPAATTARDDGSDVTIGIAYGTEKERWLKNAVEEFAKTSDGRHIKVNLIPMGSLEGAHAALSGDQRIDVWSPASAVYKNTFVDDWQAKYGTNPILREEPLALTPMVYVMWDERYQAFLAKYHTVDFDTLNRALHEPGGWSGIGNKPDWGLFKFGHTNPGESNSGIQALLLAGHSYFKQTADLSLKQVTDPAFQAWLGKFEAATDSESNSTGNLMREMVLKGPSTYDALLVYESVAIDYLKNAQGRWGALHVIYPEYNSWNDNPYYILDAPWSSDAQRKAAGAFLDFLLSEPVQKESMTHGFRPANPSVAVRTPDSPWTLYQSSGIQLDVSKICATPKAEVVTNLLADWERRDRNQ